MNQTQRSAVLAAARAAYQHAVAARQFSDVHERIALAAVKAYQTTLALPLVCDTRCVAAEVLYSIAHDPS